MRTFSLPVVLPTMSDNYATLWVLPTMSDNYATLWVLPCHYQPLYMHNITYPTRLPVRWDRSFCVAVAFQAKGCYKTLILQVSDCKQLKHLSWSPFFHICHHK